jgi:hypothetical protein
MSGLGKVVIFVMVSQPCCFSFDFLTRYSNGNLTILEFYFKKGMVMLPYKVGEGCLWWGMGAVWWA